MLIYYAGKSFLGNKRKIQALKDLIRMENPSILCIQEIKLNEKEMKKKTVVNFGGIVK